MWKEAVEILWQILQECTVVYYKYTVTSGKNYLGHTRYLHNGDPAVRLACDVLSQNIGRIIPGILVYSLGW